MKRLALILASGLVLGGCTHNTDQATSPSGNPAAADPASAQPMTITSPSLSPAKPITPFELMQDDKVYVFASAAAMGSFQAGQAQPTVVEKPNLSPRKKTVVVEAADDKQAAALLAGYEKEHGISHK